MSAEFRGFPKETFSFLAGLAKHNHKTWFDAHRTEYEQYVIEPAKAFVVALGASLRKKMPGIQAEPKVNGSIGRINRDIRFSKDKRPYNSHLHFRFWEGAKFKEGGSGFAIWMSAEEVFFGAGIYEFPKPVLLAYREAVGDERMGKALVEAVKSTEKRGNKLSGSHYKRVPAGFAPDHPRAAFLLHRGLTAGQSVLLPKSTHSAAFVGFCAKKLESLAPLHQWLTNVLAHPGREPRPGSSHRRPAIPR